METTIKFNYIGSRRKTNKRNHRRRYRKLSYNAIGRKKNQILRRSERYLRRRYKTRYYNGKPRQKNRQTESYPKT